MNIELVEPAGDWFGANPTPIFVKFDALNLEPIIAFSSVGQANGLARLFLTTPLENYLFTNDWLEVEAGNIYAGRHRIVFSEPFGSFIIIETDFIEDTQGNFQKTLNNFYILVDVLSGLPTTHAYHAQKPARKIGRLRADLDSNGVGTINLTPLLKSDFDFENNFCKYVVPSTLDLLAVDFDRFTGFSIQFSTAYEAYFLGTAFENIEGFVGNVNPTISAEFNNDFDFTSTSATDFWQTENTYNLTASNFVMSAPKPTLALTTQNRNTFTLYQNLLLTKDIVYIFKFNASGNFIGKANLIVNNVFQSQQVIKGAGGEVLFLYKATQTRVVKVGIMLTECFGTNIQIDFLSARVYTINNTFQYCVNGAKDFENNNGTFDDLVLSETSIKELLTCYSEPYPIDLGAERSYSFITGSNSELLLYFLSNLQVTLEDFTLYRLNIAKYIQIQNNIQSGILLDQEGNPLLDQEGEELLAQQSELISNIGRLSYDTGGGVNFIDFEIYEPCKITQNLSFLNSLGGFDYVLFEGKRQVKLDIENGEDLQTASNAKYFKNTVTSKTTNIENTLVKRGSKNIMLPIINNLPTAIKAYKAGAVGTECELKYEVLLDTEAPEYFDNDRILELEITYTETAPKNTQKL